MLNDSWDVAASPNEINWPDLIVKATAGSFGLEVREIYRDETAVAREEAHETHNRRLIADLASVYYEESRVPMKIDVSR